MRYVDAKRLHNGDEVTVKETGTVQRVISKIVRLGRKEVEVLLEDGYEYLHTEIR